MEGGESPLEVLSRAATMVQENQTLTILDDPTKPYTKRPPQEAPPRWKRDRRPRPPDYPRKQPPPPDAPLDMSVGGGGGRGGRRDRGLPPSYAQAISDRGGGGGGFRPSVIRAGAATGRNNRDELPSGISMCDPIIDEHFRRSLGSDYHAVFRNGAGVATPRKETAAPHPDVDEHFAKALGATWAKLNNKKEEEEENENEEEEEDEERNGL